MNDIKTAICGDLTIRWTELAGGHFGGMIPHKAVGWINVSWERNGCKYSVTGELSSDGLWYDVEVTENGKRLRNKAYPNCICYSWNLPSIAHIEELVRELRMS